MASTNDHGEVAKRLPPTLDTLKTLGLKSGNRCAFPCCDRTIYRDDTLLGQVCHIEDAMPGGRWNPANTNEQNRSEANLMLMCYEHHVITNDVTKYSAEDLFIMKQQHEDDVANYGNTPRTSITVDGEGDVFIYGSRIDGGAKVEFDGAGNKKVIFTDIDGNNSPNDEPAPKDTDTR